MLFVIGFHSKVRLLIIQSSCKNSRNPQLYYALGNPKTFSLHWSKLFRIHFLRHCQITLQILSNNLLKDRWNDDRLYLDDN